MQTLKKKKKLGLYIKREKQNLTTIALCNYEKKWISHEDVSCTNLLEDQNRKGKEAEDG